MKPTYLVEISKRSPFDEDADGVCHELLSHLEDLMGERSGEKDHLGRRGQIAVDVVDLFLEPCITREYREVSYRDYYTVTMAAPHRVSNLH